MVTEHVINNYYNCHTIISQNVLASCNFDLEFIYILSGWESSAHDSSVLTRRNDVIILFLVYIKVIHWIVWY